jgi:hypothetical protein
MNISPPSSGRKMSELGITLAVISNWSTLWRNTSPLILSSQMMEGIHSSKTSVPTRTTLCYIPEDGLLHSHHHENLKSYITVFVCFSVVNRRHGSCLGWRRFQLAPKTLHLGPSSCIFSIVVGYIAAITLAHNTNRAGVWDL